ncbi:MAG: Xaa-Pro peptidase family protein [Syntrophomonas sp.]|uniref:M24 family metallopeptidase n=1 Tax=Syntrophomonas sp. TaxID=2053627 RepID=UPI0026220949|nr:Xaa-Pro peptidase family protein [Syntrophomonas sp.]MDD2510235.1 Xaa-Pro peptidase family protein [Syntrophomonas sp.]MDD3878793.1 Xaa-Pro peptidase family protein [Syntrophomonas sp.]MDD4626819.1 Xaa-Pro peptidase family protein [Syntrophomonas sp.]
MLRLYSLLEKNEIDALLVSKAENIRYLSGFTGGSDARLLISPGEKYILTDSRYREQVKQECPDWQLREEKPPGLKQLVELSQSYKRIGFEAHNISYSYYSELQQSLKSDLQPISQLIEGLRQVKDEMELKLIRESARIADAVFSDICLKLKPGISERDIASEIVYLLRQKGCDKESFDVIVVSAENAALPHGRPGNRRLASGDMVTLDFGGFYEGYTADMSRTIAVSKASARLQELYQALLLAQEKGISMVKAGQSCREIDQVVRQSLKAFGLDQYFIHGTGHGLGLEIHEQPRLSPLSEAVLEENMVVTIEPGIYIAGWGGLRIEDSVIVKDKYGEVITRSEKNLLVL